jgi:hypothetical protein
MAPEPYAAISAERGVAAYAGVDNALLKQRHDFLRPDSIVGVVLVTDRDDASIDALSFGGRGHAFASRVFPAPPPWAADPGRERPASLGGGTTAPRGTPACALDPASPACAPCARPCASGFCFDAACVAPNHAPYHGPEEDALSVRFHRMKARYGIEPRYPVSRYVAGFRDARIPDRSSEHDAAGTYVGRATCGNALFLGTLPVSLAEGPNGTFAASDENGPMKDAEGRALDVCHLPAGSRTPEDVFLLVLAGVPGDLAAAPLDAPAWARMLGRDPARFDEAGTDPRMRASAPPRPVRPTTAIAPGAGYVEVRDWDTGHNALQFACTFPLSPERREGYRPGDDFACADGSPAPLCDAPSTQTGRRRVRGRAFPSPRPLWLARDLGAQASVASACPAVSSDATDPGYGFAPALAGFPGALGRALERK